jgi:two-component system, sensor histidine kinase and response regulator
MVSSGDFGDIIMDLQMPGMDGITATKEIRLREKSLGKSPIPIIAMTGNSSDDYGEACRQSGINGFLTKPVTLEQLIKVLSRLNTR